MWKQVEFDLQSRRRGFHLITGEILRNLPPLPEVGLLHLFIKHTSAGLSINENADPDVRMDMESIFNHLVKEREPYYQHTLEGNDDMPAHAPFYKTYFTVFSDMFIIFHYFKLSSACRIFIRNPRKPTGKCLPVFS